MIAGLPPSTWLLLIAAVTIGPAVQFVVWWRHRGR